MIHLADMPASETITANRIDYCKSTADSKGGTLHDLLGEAQPNSETCRIIFVSDDDHYAGCKICKAHLKEYWNWPEYFFQEACHKSNGYTREDFLEVGKPEEKAIKHLRCLVKSVSLGVDPETNEKVIEYTWYEMTFSLRQHSNGTVSIMCWGVPVDFHTLFQKVLVENGTDLHWRSDGERVAATLMQEIVRLYDQSVWAISKLIRKVEKGRVEAGFDFEMMHELLRHAIHTTEILEVAVDSLRELSLTRLSNTTSSTSTTPFSPPTTSPTTTSPTTRSPMPMSTTARSSSDRMHDHFDFCCRLLQNFMQRSKSNQSRLQNEIHLALNIVTRRDAQATILLSQSAQKDSAAMRTIAFVTLIFLPATFVATLFGMTFFNYQKDDGWSTTPKIWIFWAVAIPLTVFTFLAWAAMQVYAKKKNKRRFRKRTMTTRFLAVDNIV